MEAHEARPEDGASPAPAAQSSKPSEARESGVKRRALTPLAPGGLLARVLANKRSSGGDASKVKAEGVPKMSNIVGKKPVKKLVVGGLLARVQTRAGEAGSASPDAAPQTPAGQESKRPALATPVAKRQRVDPADTPSEKMSLTGEKAEAPLSKLKKFAQQAALQSDSSNTKVRPQQKQEQLPPVSTGHVDDSCLQFLHFANLLSSAEGDAAQACGNIAACLKDISCSPGNREEALKAAMFLLSSDAAIPAKVIASAITEAFGIPCESNIMAEALAAKALEGRQRKMGTVISSPVRIAEVVSVSQALLAATSDEEGVSHAAVSGLAKLLAGTQLGMEPFYLVRALQGKLAPSKDVMQRAVARAFASM